jgi:hypothetical protein
VTKKVVSLCAFVRRFSYTCVIEEVVQLNPGNMGSRKKAFSMALAAFEQWLR